MSQKPKRAETKPAASAQPEDTAQEVLRKIRQSVQRYWHLLPPEMPRDAFTYDFAGGVLKDAFPFSAASDDGTPDEAMTQAYAIRYIADVLKRMKVADPLEEMLVTQLILTHARLARLTKISKQDGIKQLKAISEACDAASNTFRRLMLALTEYRNPRRHHGFTAIGQLNAAAQQVIQQNAAPVPVPAAPPESKNQNEEPSNEKGSTARPALLPDARGTGFVAEFDPPREAVAMDARACDAAGKGTLQSERPEARAADGGSNRGTCGSDSNDTDVPADGAGE